MRAGRFAFPLVASLVACSQDTPAPSAPPAGRVEILPAPIDGDVATYIAGEVARGALDHVPVLVYVGATWCEPCRAFHTAAEAGQLDASLGGVRFLEFDLDRDGKELAAAGYQSRLVPLFALPSPEGRASGRQTEGVKTGGGYVEQLTPRLAALLR